MMDKKRIEEIAGKDFYEKFSMSKFASQMDRNNAIAQSWMELSRKLEEAHALIARLHAEAVHEGWQLVPIEPTEEMLISGQEALSVLPRHPLEDCVETLMIYRAALSAAPQPPITTPPADERDAAKRWNFIEQHWSAADIRNNKDGSFKSMTITFKSAQLSDQINRDKLRKGFDAAISSNKEQS